MALYDLLEAAYRKKYFEIMHESLIDAIVHRHEVDLPTPSIGVAELISEIPVYVNGNDHSFTSEF